MPDFYNFVAPIAKSVINWMSRRNLPITDGKIIVEGLSQPVEINRDSWGIPHIAAQNTSDLFFAQGYIHAQDRLWQMEMNRRIAQGQVSEIFGEIALDTDLVAKDVVVLDGERGID